jgi:hypothetical protein
MSAYGTAISSTCSGSASASSRRRGDPELAEDLAHVPLDGAVAEAQLRAGLVMPSRAMRAI